MSVVTFDSSTAHGEYLNRGRCPSAMTGSASSLSIIRARKSRTDCSLSCGTVGDDGARSAKRRTVAWRLRARQ
eukprot:4354240-Prymnesium_polylepis.1